MRLPLLAAGLGFLLAGIGLIVAGEVRHAEIARPVVTTIPELIEGRPTMGSVVTFAGGVNAAGRLYNLIKNSNALLGPDSPALGIPLTGDHRLTPEQWPAIEGGFVSATLQWLTKLDIVAVDRLTVDDLSLDITSRLLFVHLDHPGLWALSASESLPPTISSDGSLTEAEHAWLGAGTFKGRLQRFAEIDSNGVRGEDIERLYAQSGRDPADLVDAWVIVALDRTSVPIYGSGWHVYAPFEDSDGRIWIQAPFDSDLPERASSVTGVWLPPSSSDFAPDTNSGEKVGLILSDPQIVDDTVGERWSHDWGSKAFPAGMIALGLSAVLVLLGYVVGRYYKRGVPGFLVSYSSYLTPSSSVAHTARITFTGLSVLVLIVLFVGHMIVRDNIRFNRTGLSEATLEVIDLAIIPIFFLVLGFARSLLARGGTTVMQSDTRKPIVYLRSFRADSSAWTSLKSTEHDLTRALGGFGPVVAIGDPNRAVSPLGAARLNVDADHWQDVVKRLLANAGMIVFRIGDTEGFWWEVRHLVANADPTKVLVYVPSVDRGSTYSAFQERASGVMPKPLPLDLGKSNFIAFDADWTPHLVHAQHRSISLAVRRLLGSGTAPGLRDALLTRFSGRQIGLGVTEWAGLLFIAAMLASQLR